MYSYTIFITNNIPCNWATLLIGLQSNFITVNEINKYAENFLLEHPDASTDEILELNWLKDDTEKAILLLKELAKNIDWNLHDEIKKWRYCGLKHIRNSSNNYADMLERVALLYSDLDYPEEMESFIYYLPPNDDYNPDEFTKEQNTQRLISNLDYFLKCEYNDLRRFYTLE
ncbi:DUF2247 family protein [Bacillus pseudomycoides]|uniref:DUF2247 family protein n=1 Tax=Bacillus pseudomycoides TaxID=64104 RepID=A0AAJ1Z5T8_9BACI|nr:DUF2247 family protein [Bacillus pseudomycoides]MDR4328758.1 DUF2247 family protein [Bacillus pseudomycoides]MED1539304.1 DUF2247 family protein [Bacillus pseudomycoides]PFY86148.1 hypothetical protein COL53_25405 [Bacillus pseudomycoides]PFZ82144.1 hypothetical protein COL70_29785 [Bacillus pseudomycoides]PHD05123.1 hypothetical protein COF46_27530 [Bacillus pseudomycoides]